MTGPGQELSLPFHLFFPFNAFVVFFFFFSRKLLLLSYKDAAGIYFKIYEVGRSCPVGTFSKKNFEYIKKVTLVASLSSQRTSGLLLVIGLLGTRPDAKTCREPSLSSIVQRLVITRDNDQ